MDNSKSTVARTPNLLCPFCLKHERHTADNIWQRELHPYRGHGYTKETGWTHPGLEPKEPQ